MRATADGSVYAPLDQMASETILILLFRERILIILIDSGRNQLGIGIIRLFQVLILCSILRTRHITVRCQMICDRHIAVASRSPRSCCCLRNIISSIPGADDHRNLFSANRNKWLKTHIPNNNFYDVLKLKTVEECHANLPSKMILARYFYAITEMCVSSITG